MMNTSYSCDQHCRVDAFLNEVMSVSQQLQFESHLEACPECRLHLEQRTAETRFWAVTRTYLSGSSRFNRLGHGEQSNGSDHPVGFLDATDDPNMMGRFAGYEISGIVGRGGMGIVIKGWDRSLNRFVAVKLLAPTYAEHSASRKRFRREARCAAAVLHDNVIAIYGVDEWKGIPYLVMPYIKGQSLQQRIDREAPLPLEDVLGIAMQIARGLSAAHDQGLVHRDIKPANILMPENVSRVIITDFGLARTVDDASLTRSGVLAGTPQFMAPEQARGEPLDGRTDLFSLGSVMYAMACGRPPFRADTPYAMLRKITDAPHRPIHQVRETLPKWFCEIVDRCLEKSPDDRFQTSAELADHLEDCLSHLRQPNTSELPKLPITRTFYRDPKHRRFRVMVSVITALSLVVLAIGSLAYFVGGKDNHQKNMRSGDSDVVSESAAADEASTVPPWQFDDSQLSALEREIDALLQDTNLSTNDIK